MDTLIHIHKLGSDVYKLERRPPSFLKDLNRFLGPLEVFSIWYPGHKPWGGLQLVSSFNVALRRSFGMFQRPR
jgi:hypothetical protein